MTAAVPASPAAKAATSRRPAAEDSPIAGHGAAKLPSVIVDACNSQLRDDDGFIGDRARRSAFFKALDRWRSIAGEADDPFEGASIADISKKTIDRVLGDEAPRRQALALSAVEDYAQALAGVVRRFMRTKEWRETQRIVIGGGLSAARTAQIAIARAELLLREAEISVELVPIRNDPDEAGLIGAAHLAPRWMFAGHDSIVAVDIGGTNMRAGIVELNLKKREDLSKASVSAFELWRHGDEEGLKREDAIDGLVGMLKSLIRTAEKSDLKLAPFIGIGCPGEIGADGSIETGAQNLPGNWQSRRFNLPAALREAIPEIAGEETAVVMHNDAVVQGLSEAPFMRDVERWGVMTIGTGLGNARFTNREAPKSGD
ncbi:ROK family protein [Ancylobacter terrae]|uniref:ROK family protein n=1 Tax=Ancylobacter sp. sgz301288 TaxID=3342077 RepID=UPI003859B819